MEHHHQVYCDLDHKAVLATSPLWTVGDQKNPNNLVESRVLPCGVLLYSSLPTTYIAPYLTNLWLYCQFTYVYPPPIAGDREGGCCLQAIHRLIHECTSVNYQHRQSYQLRACYCPSTSLPSARMWIQTWSLLSWLLPQICRNFIPSRPPPNMTESDCKVQKLWEAEKKKPHTGSRLICTSFPQARSLKIHSFVQIKGMVKKH